MGSSFSLGAAAVIFVAESYAAVGMVLAFDHLLLLVTLVAVLLVAAVLVLVDDCFQTIARSNRASARAFQLEETARDPA